MSQILVVPHKGDGTHVIIYNKYKNTLFGKKREKLLIIMETYNNFKQSKTDKIFCLIKDEKGKVNICLGGYAVSTKKFDSFEQAEKYIACKPWEMIVNLIGVMDIIKQKHNETLKENAEKTAKDAKSV